MPTCKVAACVHVSRLFVQRRALLATVSALAVMVAGPDAMARSLSGKSPSAPSAAAIAAAQSAQRDAQRAAQAAQNALKRATLAIQARQASQKAARDAARMQLNAIAGQPPIPDGIGAGGLNPLTGGLWQGAKPLNDKSQTTKDGRTKVIIDQDDQKAILTWDSFNIGRNTDVVFDQGAGNWVALNRVMGSSAAPSQILGTLNAKGSIYVINQNGIIFGGASQVNVGSLIASTAMIDPQKFLDSGIYSTGSGSNWTPSFTNAAALLGVNPDNPNGGVVKVAAGAQIKTHAPASVTSGGGFVYLFGGEVQNAGSITTALGQTILAAGDDFVLRPGYGTDGNQSSTTRGSEVAVGSWNGSNLFSTATGGGLVRNAGLITSSQGDITLAGRTILQDAILLSSTSVDTRGTIHLLNAANDTAGSITLGSGSLTAILPELDSKATALNSQRDALIEASNEQRAQSATGAFNNLSLLADRLDQSRIEIVTGGNVVFEGGSITRAQGGQVAVSAGRRVFTESGATIDVSGVRGVQLAMSANNILVNIQGNELRDSPQNRDSDYLKNEDVWVDLRDLIYVPAGTGGYDSDRYYTPGGLLEVGGYLANTAHSIGEWASVGGTITLAAPEVIAQKGSIFDISGGSVAYEGGYILTSNFRDRNGRIYNINNARADMTFYGLGQGFSRSSERWGMTESWDNPFARGRVSKRWEDGYTVGRDAGRLNLSTPTAVFEGDILADVIQGQRQVNARPDGITDGYSAGQNVVAKAGTLALGRYDARGTSQIGFHASDVRFGDVDAITAGLSATDALTPERTGTAWFDAGHINAQKLGGLDIGTSETITIDSAITLADGGEIALTGPVVDIKADITARSGSLTVDNHFKGDSAGGRGLETVLLKNGTASITVRDGVTLDMRGQWVNARDNRADFNKQAFIDGGSVTLRSTHDVTLEEGSTIDVSSGAAVLTSGKTKGGRGGDVTLVADQSALGTVADGLLTLNGEVRAYGVSGGGTLKLESGTSIAIGGKLLATDGVLGAGEKAPTDLVLLNDYLVKAGEVLPVNYSYQATVFIGGDRLTETVSFQNVRLAADWTVPFGNGNNIIVINTSTGQQIRIEGENVAATLGIAPTVIPAGTVISISTQYNDGIKGYVLPGNVFPDGVPSIRYVNGIPTVTPFLRTVPAGTVAPNDVTLAAGTRLTAGLVLPRAAAVKPFTQIGTALFQSGFSGYDITGHNGVAVANGARIDAAMPVYRLNDKAFNVASGADPARALDVWTPPEWIEDAGKGRLTQRGGASVTLRAVGADGTSASVLASGTVAVGEGASIRVDAGQSITLQGTDFTIDGTLTAPSGTIALTQPIDPDDRGLGGKAGLFWIGEHAVLDVAARAVTARDARGRTYGVVANGGSIQIGGALDWETSGEATAPQAFVVIRSGALLDASGASATFDIPTSGLQKAGTPLAVASNGGSIVIKSGHGLYLDGTMRAAAAGANAAGGTLGIALETFFYPNRTVSGDVLRHREVVIADVQGDSALAGAVSMEAVKAGLVTGTARLGVDRIKAGGFDNLSVLADGVLSFDGNVSLAMRQSLQLYAGAFGLTEQAPANARVSLSAPYVRMAGATRGGRDNHTLAAVRWESGYGNPTQQASNAVFDVDADLLDIRDRVVFGVAQRINVATSAYMVDRRGFGLIDLTSRGDIRMLAKTSQVLRDTALQTPGNISLTAAQIYPATGAFASIRAGFTGTEDKLLAGSVLDIRRYGDAVPAMPYSAFGTLELAAETVNQGGIVRAPFGSLRFGTINNTAQSDVVRLLPGSITSISGAGLVMPYGGTRDGITYSYNGTPVNLSGVGGMGSVSVITRHFDAQAGSVLDLSGGGELIGAGFVSGRGGSVNVITTPLVNSNPGYTYSAKGNQVYAIVPGSAGRYAPAVQEAGYGAPQIGQQITIPDGVPGLKAGTYTLMPATYALLPGAYRVEIGSSVLPGRAGAAAIGNGSYVANGYLGVANTSIRASLPSQVIVTPGKVVRTHSSYNEMGYNDFVRADAVRIGVPRAAMTIDARVLDIRMDKPVAADGRSQLNVDGDLRIRAQAGSAGFDGAVQLHGISEVLATGQTATAGMAAASVHADEINKLNAPRLVLNGSIGVSYGQNGHVATINSDFSDSIIRSGAHLSAAEIILAGRGRTWADEIGRVTIEEGASLSTIGRGRASYDSSDGYVFVGNGVLMLSNGTINLMQGEAQANSGYEVQIAVGSCVTSACNRTTTLVSEGTIAAATAGSFSMASNVSYGTRNLVLGMSAINLGDEASLAAAAAAGRLPAGLGLNQNVLANLLAGNTATGAPALETLALNARNSVNVFGDVTLDASKVGRLVLGTPAIYGYGDAGDVATIRAGEFVWTGLAAAPGAPIVDMLGDGKLNIAANRVVLGYGPNTQPNTQIVDNRIALGFTDVSISASEHVTSTNKSTLGVYHRQGAYEAGKGYQYTGGNLTIATPLFTGAGASSNTITAGGNIRVVGTGGAAAPVDALGAKIELKGANVAIDTSVVLPSGRLVVTATGDIVLGDNSRLDMSGRAVKIFDVTKYSWGGDLVLTSSGGNIRQDAGSLIDLSAQNNRGGTALVTALGGGAGYVELNGKFRGSASGQYDAGGTLVPYDAAEITVQAQTLADFSGLNTRLNEGGVFGARRFQIKQGNLVVGNEVKARNVEIVADGGSLTVNGTIDASGYQVGSIRLAAMGDLVINGLLDAHGTGMRFDSYGKIIDAPNRAIVDLTTRQGTLSLTSNAAVDLRAGTAVVSGIGSRRNDGVARGSLTLNAPRLGGSGVAGGTRGVDGANDVAVNVQGALPIRGAKTIAVNAFRVYDDAPIAAAPDVTGTKPQEITQAYLDAIDVDSTAFIDAALANSAVSARLAGLGNYRLRPGVDIVSKVSADNPNGDLTISGDLDLSGYRYGPNANRFNPALRGYGEPGAINFRAAGNLNIRGSINDGFAPPPETTADNGWVLDQGVVPYGGDLTLPIAVTLEAGTVFKTGATLNYDLPTGAVTLPAGVVLPVRATLTASLTLAAGTVVDATVYNANGTVAYAAGTVLSNDVTLTAGMQLAAGTVLRNGASIAALTWPKGVPLPVDMASSTQLGLAAGSLIPSMTNVKLLGGNRIELRAPTGGRQAQNWAVAPMLGAGATSWDMQLTAGADLASADVRARNALGKGNIVLADTHYASRTASGGVFINLNEAGALAILAGLGFDYPGLSVADLIGKSEAQIVAELGGPGVTWRDFVDAYGFSSDFWNPSTGNIELGLTMQGVDAVVALNGLPPGISDKSQLLNLTRREIASLFGDPNYSWADFGVPPDFADYGQGNLDTISLPPSTTFASPSFSVVRTGTGNLSLTAAGNIRMDSLYGVYTAGTATAVDPAYNRPRGLMEDGTLLGPTSADFASATATYQAWYPDQGGNVLIAAGGNLIGDIYGRSWRNSPSTVLAGNWLWRQGTGTTAVDTPIPTAWWINFGTYVPNTGLANGNQARLPDLVGFTGIGALGGGNVAIRVGGEAGAIALRGSQAELPTGEERSQGLVVAVGSTGRVGADGSLTLTGGGDIDMRIAGALNPQLALIEGKEKHALPGAVIDLRGAMHLNAESIGGLKLVYGVVAEKFDPRGLDPFTPSSSHARSGLTLVPGDSTMTVQTRGDLVLGGAGDPGRSVSPNEQTYSAGGVNYIGGGQTWFSLWTDHTAIDLISLGGNLTPTTASSELQSVGVINLNTDHSAIDGTVIYPSILRAAALGGSIYYGVSALPYMRSSGTDVYPFVTLAPSPHGTLEMLAGNSIRGGQYGFSLSGTGTPMPTPFNPAFMGRETDALGRTLVTNGSSTSTVDGQGGIVPGSLFVFGPNTATIPVGRAPDADPIRFYARSGDVIGLYTGEIQANVGSLTTWYNTSGPLMVRAGRDIVGSGLAPGVTQTRYGGGATRGNLIVHSDPNDVSVISAGRDIVFANFDIAGPGTLEVSAGRNLYQADKGAITSMGPIAVGDTRPGASIAMLAGVGVSGPDYDGLAARYLDPAKLATSGTPLADQPGKVAKTYEKELAAWLKERYGFAGSDAEACAYFDGLAPEQRHIFLRTVYFAELTAGGREYNDQNSPRFRSYLRGREVIAALFPEKEAFNGDLTMFGASGVRTLSGGDIQMLTPGGRSVIGVEGLVPPSTAGLITQGSGNIQMYSKGSILLGLSRIMTTFGGDVLAWSAEGDINAGRGAKTTIVYTPPRRTTDNYGNVTLSPAPPSSGAGIASRSSVPGVPGGDIDLIAPLGTIDAGEAGIRSGANVNLAALRIVNAANIQAQGNVTGVPQIQAPNIGGLTEASNTSGAAAQAAATPEQQGVANQPSVIIVEVLGFGGDEGESDGQDKRKQQERQSQDLSNRYQVLGAGELTDEQTEELAAHNRKLVGR